MAFPASQQTVEDALKSIRDGALTAKINVQRLRDLSTTQAVARKEFTNLQRSLDLTVDRWDAASAVPGLVQYARDQYADQTLDIAVEYTAMRVAAIALRDWVFTAIPRDGGSGAVLLKTIDAEGLLTDITVSTAQSAGFRTEADAFLLTIS